MTAKITFSRALIMGPTTTLTSLAMLRVEINHGSDYLDYLTPFVEDALFQARPTQINDEIAVQLIREKFGLAIPQRTIHILLKRLARKGILKKENGIYKTTKKEFHEDLTTRKSEAIRHIHAVVNGLKKYSESLGITSLTDDKAVSAICGFLSKFNVDYLKAYLRGSAIPEVDDQNPKDIVLVSKYALQLKENDPERFQSFIILLQGHMLANALMCPDLQDAPKSFKGVNFYLDTPLLIQSLGLEGDLRKQAIDELLNLLRELGAKIFTFSHCREELDRVINSAITYIESPKGRGEIIRQAKLANKDKADLILAAATIDENLAQANIPVEETPKYIQKFQIDEQTFEEYLGDEVSYLNDRAREYDINSVRSIYVLREGKNPIRLENCSAVFVTSNSGFSKAAYNYGKTHANHLQISSVITDFSLANVAWLKAPLGAPNIPTAELLAFAYAAKQPSNQLLNKYLDEIESLEKQGNISTRDHQPLRSSTSAQDHLMDMTLGDEQALTAETVNETLKRVTAEITADENKKLDIERIEKSQLKSALEENIHKKSKAQERLYWQCDEDAETASKLIYRLLAIGILILLYFAIGELPDSSAIKKYSNEALVIIGAIAFAFDHSLPQFRERLKIRIRNHLLSRKKEILELLD